ncbi:MAG: hypothetical protein M3014_15660 [Chloroflexota bacterium]|nr:hypothetical protein [Chloroflexota bacterium]
MSEYQYYEFHALDRRLTESEMADIRTLSSRVALTSTSAIFTYHFGDFRGRPESVLEKYFDAMLYTANWGTRRLMFRFPKGLANTGAIEPYCIPDIIILKTTNEHVILDIFINEEGGDWIDEDEVQLAGMIPLRDAILAGDYRALYLAWLRACELELGPADAGDDLEEDEEDDEDAGAEGYYGLRGSGGFLHRATPEPPVPPNLGHLNGALEAFTDFFEIDPLWIEAAAKASAAVSKPDEPVERWIASLPEADCRRLLLRAARGEPNIALSIMNELREQFAEPPRPVGPGKRRTAGELLAIVQERRRRAAEEKRRQAEVARIRRLDDLAKRETAAWTEVLASIQQRNAKGYDQAVILLRELRELAAHRGEQAAFQQRVEQLAAQFHTLPGLRSRMVEARLIVK